MMIEIIAPSRLHFSLSDLGNASLYMYGGIGVGISEPSHKITCTKGSGNIHFHGEAKKWKAELEKLFHELNAHCGTDLIDIDVTSMVPPHSGFGSHTALCLGLIEAVGIATESGWSEGDIVSLSRRGGTSGVGIQTYFHGGLAYDYGRPALTGEHHPSSIETKRSEVLSGPQVPFPSHWEVLVVLPKGKHVYGETEVMFFRDNTPTDPIEALRAIATIHHGILPAIMSANLSVLTKSLAALHKCGFKRLELSNQSQAVQAMYHRFVSLGFACGLSSFGPLLYAIVDASDTEAKTSFFHAAKDNDVLYPCVTKASNGRELLCR